MTDALRDEETIAHDMIDVHGTEAATVTTMYISLAHSRTHGFLKWCEACRSGNDAVKPDRAAPVTITKPPGADHAAIKPLAYQPWLVPGVGSSL